MTDTMREYSTTNGPPPPLDAVAGFDTRRAIGCILAYADEERREKVRFNDLNARAVQSLLDDWWEARVGGVPPLSDEAFARKCRELVGRATDRAHDMLDEEYPNAIEDSTLMALLAWHLTKIVEEHDKRTETAGRSTEGGE